MDEGYIKYHCNWIEANNTFTEQVAALNVWRDVMYQKGWMGMYSNGIGYGNISMRINGNTFLISGTATGGVEKLDDRHYCLVEAYSIEHNSVTCRGPIKASSESLTHAMIYETSPEINAVIHIHNMDMWNDMKNKIPTSHEAVAYGTTEMALEIKRLFTTTQLAFSKIMVMAGHEEGIISFGKDIAEAGNILMDAMSTR